MEINSGTQASPQSYFVFCDESADHGPFFDSFYGGVIVRSDDYGKIEEALARKCQSLNLTGEAKFTKVTAHYLDKYYELMDLLFDYVALGELRVRVMFHHKRWAPGFVPPSSTRSQHWMPYYQFIKLGLGFDHAPSLSRPYQLHIWFDQLPHSQVEIEKFFNLILRLPAQRPFSEKGVRIRRDSLHPHVRSHDHRLMQCLDIVLGAMQFKLNNHHKVQPGKFRLGRRTKAKLAIYKHIHGRITQIKPNFNIGITTGGDRWALPYRHMEYVPFGATHDATKTKGNRRRRSIYINTPSGTRGFDGAPLE